MCGLCGLLGITHWTETSAHPQAFSDDKRRTMRAERIHRSRIVNTALAPTRLKVSDFQASTYIVASPKGKTEIIDDIQAVWSSVERLHGGLIDPLDDAYLNQLDEMGR